MDNNKSIVKALLEKNYVDAKESIFKSLYAKASLLLDEERIGIASDLFSEDKKMGIYSDDPSEKEDKKEKKKSKNEKPSMYEETEEVAEEEAELEEDIQTPERAAEMRRKVKASDRGVDRAAAKYVKTPTKANNQAHSKAIKHHFDVAGQNAKEQYSKKTYGKGGKVVEETEQLDEVSPPGMEKMTGSPRTKAAFAKQYGKRGKEVMYATAWKQYNKKAGKD